MQSLDTQALRRALGCFPTGVTVVTALAADASPRGFTANSFTSVSLSPPLVSICVDHRAASLDVYRLCEVFAVNVLSEDQREVSNLFAGKSPRKFERVRWRRGQHGAPLLDGCAAWFECTPHARTDAGDHLLLIGEVQSFGHCDDTRPLSFCRGNYLSLGLEQQAMTRAAATRMRIGAILEHDGRIAMVPGADADTWRLPEGEGRGGDQFAEVRALLEANGIDATFDFLFAVFEDPAAGELHVFYRGEIMRGPVVSARARLFAYADIPWPALPSDAQRDMLRRYIEERERFEFGVYLGSTSAGTVSRAGGR